jgi:hypothetical protein
MLGRLKPPLPMANSRCIRHASGSGCRSQKRRPVTQSVANVIEDLKLTGLLELIARDAIYEINDDACILKPLCTAFAATRPAATGKPSARPYTARSGLCWAKASACRSITICSLLRQHDQERPSEDGASRRTNEGGAFADPAVKRIGVAGHHLSPPDSDGNERRRVKPSSRGWKQNVLSEHSRALNSEQIGRDPPDPRHWMNTARADDSKVLLET